jgi:hypothetical protein
MLTIQIPEPNFEVNNEFATPDPKVAGDSSTDSARRATAPPVE